MPNKLTAVTDDHVTAVHVTVLRSNALSFSVVYDDWQLTFKLHYLKFCFHLLMSDCFQGDKVFRKNFQKEIMEKGERMLSTHLRVSFVLWFRLGVRLGERGSQSVLTFSLLRHLSHDISRCSESRGVTEVALNS
jgi:hypothetical protein